MKKFFSLLFAFTMAIVAQAQLEKAPAFPGAEGHGRFVTGGRGGNVIRVTNLNDNGPGSLRNAVAGNSRKIVVFDVAGVIALASNLTIGDNTTILGQTAPAPGITVRYFTVQPGGNNIIRFVRFRRGEEKDVNDGADATWQRQKTGIILDHCSFSWSIDEVASFYDNNNFTMQWCTVAESLLNAGHDKGAHGYGGIWGGKLASFHHNMIAHVANRSPRFNGARYKWTGYTSNYDYKTYNWKNTVEAENVDFRNCVIYNSQGGCYGGPGGGQINIVNNYYKAGPSGKGNQERVTTITVGAPGNGATGDMEGMTSRYYMNGNTTEKADGTKKENRDWNGISYDSGLLSQDGTYWSLDESNYYTTVEHKTIGGKQYVDIKMTEPCPTGFVTTHSAAKAYEKVLQYVGASLHRDVVDERYVTETTNGTATYTGSVSKTKGLIDRVSDCEGYTENTFGEGKHPEGFDTDGDGIPDDWEKQYGLNPNDASDAAKITLDEKGFYTNIELYANSLVEEIMKGGVTDATSTFEEYYPVLKEGGTPGGGDNPGGEVTEKTEMKGYSYPDDASDANSITFEDGAVLTITGNASKNISKGKEITVDGVTRMSLKLSNGAENTFVAPEGKTIAKVTFYSYINKDEGSTDRTSFWGNIDGTVYTAENAQILKSYKDGENPDIVSFDINRKGQFTFTNSGDQLCYVMDITYVTTSGIENVTVDDSHRYGDRVYNLQGQRVNANHKGIVIQNRQKRIVK